MLSSQSKQTDTTDKLLISWKISVYSHFTHHILPNKMTGIGCNKHTKRSRSQSELPNINPHLSLAVQKGGITLKGSIGTYGETEFDQRLGAYSHEYTAKQKKKTFKFDYCLFCVSIVSTHIRISNHHNDAKRRQSNDENTTTCVWNGGDRTRYMAR
eukprot:323525_1